MYNHDASTSLPLWDLHAQNRLRKRFSVKLHEFPSVYKFERRESVKGLLGNRLQNALAIQGDSRFSWFPHVDLREPFMTASVLALRWCLQFRSLVASAPRKKFEWLLCRRVRPLWKLWAPWNSYRRQWWFTPHWKQGQLSCSLSFFSRVNKTKNTNTASS